MTKPTFRDLWETVISEMRADAEALQVEATAIQAGVVEFDKEGRLLVPVAAPPSVFIYCIPGTGRLSEAGLASPRTATIAMLGTPVQADDVLATVCEATELAERIERTVKTRLKKLLAADPGIAIDNPGSGMIRSLIAFAAHYKSSTEPA